MLVVGHDHGNMAVGSIVLSVVPIGKLIGTRKSEFAGSPPLPRAAGSAAAATTMLVHVTPLVKTPGQNRNSRHAGRIEKSAARLFVFSALLVN